MPSAAMPEPSGQEEGTEVCYLASCGRAFKRDAFEEEEKASRGELSYVCHKRVFNQRLISHPKKCVVLHLIFSKNINQSPWDVGIHPMPKGTLNWPTTTIVEDHNVARWN